MAKFVRTSFMDGLIYIQLYIIFRLELKATFSDRLEFIFEVKEIRNEQNVLSVEIWRIGNNKDKWEAAKFHSRICSDGTIILTITDLEDKSDYDVRILCQVDNEKMLFSNKNQLQTEGKLSSYCIN